MSFITSVSNTAATLEFMLTMVVIMFHVTLANLFTVLYPFGPRMCQHLNHTTAELTTRFYPQNHSCLLQSVSILMNYFQKPKNNTQLRTKSLFNYTIFRNILKLNIDPHENILVNTLYVILVSSTMTRK